MKALIIEAGGSHVECIYSFNHFLSLKGCEVHICCNRGLIKLVRDAAFTGTILPLPDSFTFRSSISSSMKIRKYIRLHKIGIVVINTTEIKFLKTLVFFLPANILTAGLIHNARKLEKKVSFMRIISMRIKKFLVPGEFLLQELSALSSYKIAPFYPIYFPKVNKNNILKAEDEFWIIIPGEVITERRHYRPLLEKMLQTSLPVNIKIILLGYLPPASEIALLLANAPSLQKQVITFSQYLDYNLFHSYMALADIILPLLKTDEGNFYTNKRISGSFNLGLGYHIPFLLPFSYYENKDIRPFSFYYKDMDGLEELLINVSKNKAMMREMQEKYKASKWNNIQLLADNFFSFITA